MGSEDGLMEDWEKAQAARRIGDGLPEGFVLLTGSVDESIEDVLRRKGES